MSHLEERMEADLNAIRDWVWKIGDDVENALHEAKKTLVLRDKELAYRIILGDHPINRASRRCDRMCHRFIARYLPGAGALRERGATQLVEAGRGGEAVVMLTDALDERPDDLALWETLRSAARSSPRIARQVPLGDRSCSDSARWRDTARSS